MAEPARPPDGREDGSERATAAADVPACSTGPVGRLRFVVREARDLLRRRGR